MPPKANAVNSRGILYSISDTINIANELKAIKAQNIVINAFISLLL